MLKQPLPTTFAILFVACCSIPSVASAADLPDSLQLGQSNLVLNGTGVRRSTLLNLYESGLYLPKKQTIRPRSSKPMCRWQSPSRSLPSSSVKRKWSPHWKLDSKVPRTDKPQRLQTKSGDFNRASPMRSPLVTPLRLLTNQPTAWLSTKMEFGRA